MTINKLSREALLTRAEADLCRLRHANYRLRIRVAVLAVLLVGSTAVAIASFGWAEGNHNGSDYSDSSNARNRNSMGFQASPFYHNPYWNFVPGRLCCTQEQIAAMARANTAYLQARQWEEAHPIVTRVLSFFGIQRDFGAAHYEAPGYGSWSW
jgi:hypothetical protein